MESPAGAGLMGLGGLGLRFLAGLNQVALERGVSLRCGVKTLPVLQRSVRLAVASALSVKAKVGTSRNGVAALIAVCSVCIDKHSSDYHGPNAATLAVLRGEIMVGALLLFDGASGVGHFVSPLLVRHT